MTHHLTARLRELASLLALNADDDGYVDREALRSAYVKRYPRPDRSTHDPGMARTSSAGRAGFERLRANTRGLRWAAKPGKDKAREKLRGDLARLELAGVIDRVDDQVRVVDWVTINALIANDIPTGMGEVRFPRSGH